MTKNDRANSVLYKENVILQETCYFQETGKRGRIERDRRWEAGKVMGQL